LTTKGRYAVTAMLDLASHAGVKPTTLADIARRQGISLSYLEQLFAPLRRQSLVVSVRGPGGGYRLARDPDRIFIGEVIVAVDEQLDATRCGGERDCQARGACLTHQLWEDLSDHIRGYLHGISLKDLVDHKQVKPGVERRTPRGEGFSPRVPLVVRRGTSRIAAGPSEGPARPAIGV